MVNSKYKMFENGVYQRFFKENKMMKTFKIVNSEDKKYPYMIVDEKGLEVYIEMDEKTGKLMFDNGLITFGDMDATLFATKNVAQRAIQRLMKIYST